MKTIPVAGTGGRYALVDDDAYELVAASAWRATGRGYPESQRAGARVSMARLVLATDPAPGQVVSYRDGDPLNNQRANLRYCTRGEAQRNQRKRAHATSRFKGVAYDRVKLRWRAHICVNRKQIYLGRFLTEVEAAAAYNRAALEHHGESARLNELADHCEILPHYAIMGARGGSEPPDN